jgi:hypothetical protein
VSQKHFNLRGVVLRWLTFFFAIVLDNDVMAVPLLASYTYYRSLRVVPSLVRTWWEGCKNRQLSRAVAGFTARHFSPLLIARELAHLRTEDLSDGDMTVKVSMAVNEVKAVYVVDDQPMEIGVRLPSEFPLLPVEVKDIRKVGVSDAQWRAWILNVQQVITAQVALHFLGFLSFQMLTYTR